MQSSTAASQVHCRPQQPPASPEICLHSPVTLSSNFSALFIVTPKTPYFPSLKTDEKHMKVTSVRKTADVCSSQVSRLTIFIISKVLFAACEAKILHGWDTGMKEADGLAQTPPCTETSAAAEREHNANRTSRATWQSPVCLTPHRSAHKKCQQQGYSFLARESQVLEGYSF